jgi:hypothetical protein
MEQHLRDGACMEPETYPLKTGDRVRLTPLAVAFYGGAWPHFVPEGQGGGTEGTLLFAGERPHKPGATPRPYYVRWDNGVENTYRVEDLQAAPTSEEEEVEEDAPNVIPFGRRPSE